MESQHIVQESCNAQFSDAPIAELLQKNPASMTQEELRSYLTQLRSLQLPATFKSRLDSKEKPKTVNTQNYLNNLEAMLK